MDKNDLRVSPVIFDEGEHTYTLDARRLSGITGLIHSILGLGIYPEADEYTKNFLIPRAGSRGTAVHHAIQSYDEKGAIATVHEIPEHLRKGDTHWDVTYELTRYIDHKTFGGFRAVANEYTVSDEKRYASQIDNVWEHEETKGIWLIDTKTNNIDLYPICGYFKPRYFSNRKDALKEYLSWQLSCYAVLFERQNPGLKVEGLACNWLRKDTGEFWIIKRKPDEIVDQLLSSDCYETDNGWVYYHPNLEVFGISKTEELPDVVDESLPEVTPEVIDYVSGLYNRLEELKSQYEEAKEGIRKAMLSHDIYKADLGKMKLTLTTDSKAKTFDTKRFKEEHPDLYKQYLIEKEKKGSLILKFSNNND